MRKEGRGYFPHNPGGATDKKTPSRTLGEDKLAPKTSTKRGPTILFWKKVVEEPPTKVIPKRKNGARHSPQQKGETSRNEKESYDSLRRKESHHQREGNIERYLKEGRRSVPGGF